MAKPIEPAIKPPISELVKPFCLMILILTMAGMIAKKKRAKSLKTMLGLKIFEASGWGALFFENRHNHGSF
jgi:hypothetical protein